MEERDERTFFHPFFVVRYSVKNKIVRFEYFWYNSIC